MVYGTSDSRDVANGEPPNRQANRLCERASRPSSQPRCLAVAISRRYCGTLASTCAPCCQRRSACWDQVGHGALCWPWTCLPVPVCTRNTAFIGASGSVHDSTKPWYPYKSPVYTIIKPSCYTAPARHGGVDIARNLNFPTF